FLVFFELKAAVDLCVSVDFCRVVFRSVYSLVDGTVLSGIEQIVFYGGSGDDIIQGGSSSGPSDIIDGGEGNDRIDGNSGIDFLRSEERGEGKSGDLGGRGVVRKKEWRD